MKLYAKSDTGKIRETNQDFFVVGESDTYAYAIVCDGMGGCKGGNVASEMAVNIIKEHLEKELHNTLFDDIVRYAVIDGIKEANKEIFKRASEDENLAGMGTTAVVAVAANDKLYIAHVGDSRAYLIKNEDYKQLTRDHSLVQELVERGELSADEANGYYMKNIITRAIGVSHNVDVDFSAVPFEDDELLLICTDGLSNYLDEESFKKILRENPREEYVDKLVSFAIDNGGADNITAAVIIKK
jgi:protein phosphatase